MQYIWLVFFWSIYFLHHSLFSSDSVKAYFLDIGLSLKNQRFIYTIFSVLALLLILLFNGLIGGEKLLMENRLIKAFALFLAAGGVFILREAFKTYSLRAFVGFSEDTDLILRTTGILRHIRHPLYSAAILIFTGFVLYDSRVSSIISWGCVMAYLPIGIWLEEKKLIKTFGEQYKQYAEKVPMLIPDLRKR